MGVNNVNNYVPKYPVIEIFKSIEGEGIRVGQPSIFVRFFKCNLSCEWCDTKYANDQTESSNLTASQIVDRIQELGGKNVTLTGGEPLLSMDVVKWLIRRYPEYEFNIETNGSLPIYPVQLDNTIITMDYKCPSSEQEDKMYLANLEQLRTKDVLKFVVADDNDLNTVLSIVQTYDIKAQIYLSPVFGSMDLEKLANFVINNAHLKLNLSIQIHKIVWDPNKRGV